jgi:hypothetical protein
MHLTKMADMFQTDSDGQTWMLCNVRNSHSMPVHIKHLFGVEAIPPGCTVATWCKLPPILILSGYRL